ncbi:hypothetical protein BXZ70DRAFT_1012254 [Cristinia sonorae]|uniref:DUF6533 domain-containing protein n=1 Tax=Cristinia sonorae TaxID=1940300 RepID=A0A8K0UG08_9AGAR|nr:hypothetical protein BXZ70DRAFT_1012254 [Cristinia sonorae]
MSDDANDPETQQAIRNALQRLIVENYCIVASSALLFFDFSITFTREVKRIWHRRVTGATVVFILTRYSVLAERIVLLTTLFIHTLSDDRYSTSAPCVPVLRVDDTLTDLSYLSIGAFTALRLYGIYHEYWPPALVISIWLARVGIAIPPTGPEVSNNRKIFNNRTKCMNVATRLNSASNALVLSADTLLLALTWVKTYRIQKTSIRLGLRAPLSMLLLRDGTVYFAAILFMQIFAIVSSEVGSSFVLFDVWTYFVQVFNVIFLCRFMLNLRGIYLSDTEDTEITTRPMSDVNFAATIVGNMGAPLEPLTFISHARTTTQDESEDSDLVEVSRNPIMVGLSPNEADQIEMQDAVLGAC